MINMALIMTNFLCDSRNKKYYINLPLVSMLTKTAVSLGAEPYGLGHLECGLYQLSVQQRKTRDLKAYKAKVDPNNIMNPGKFFGINSNGISALIFHPAVFSFSMNLLILLSPVIGKIGDVASGKG